MTRNKCSVYYDRKPHKDKTRQKSEDFLKLKKWGLTFAGSFNLDLLFQGSWCGK